MEILRNLSVIWSFLHVLVIFIFLYESRYSRKKTIILTCLFMIPLMVLNIILYILVGPEKAAQLILISCTLPSLIFFYIMAKNKDGRFLFTFCFADTITYEIIVITSLIDYYFAGNQYIFTFISRLIALPLLEFAIWKWLRSSYLQLQNIVKRGWTAFAGLSALFYVLLVIMSSVPVIMFEQPNIIPPLILVLILMPLMYVIVFQVLYKQQHLFEANEQEQLLYLQTTYMAQRMKQTAETEERIRMERHNMRHRLQTISSMIEKQEYKDALEYLSASEKNLDEFTQKRWCTNNILDAVFSLFFKQAEAEEIRLETTLSIPEELPFDPIELSMVFANTLENAINACRKLPKEKRVILVKCLSTPQYMFSISNPYEKEIEFDSSGHPISTYEGHGYGTKTIIAFCEKHKAYYEYKAENNWFSLRITL